MACVVFVTSQATRAQLQGAPVRVDASVALKQVTKKVEPALPPEVVAAHPGALIAADLIVKTDGTVEAVTIITSPKPLEAPTIAALKQWTFRPFLVNGRPVRAVTVIDISLPDPRRDAEMKAANDYSTAHLACERALATRASDADALCGHLVHLSDGLESARVLERVSALELHGLSLLFTNRPGEALARFERAIETRKRIAGADADADMATLIEMAAQAQIRLGTIVELQPWSW